MAPGKQSKRVLVTGGAGFIGANLVRRLLKDAYEVHVLLRRKTDMRRIADCMSSLTVHWGDITDRLWVEKTLVGIKPSYIFHLAQYGGYSFQKDPEKIFTTNFWSTVYLLTAAEKTGFKKFIHIGSSSEYGEKRKMMSEDDLLEPNNMYGISKAAATLYCIYRGRDGKLPIVVLRPFSVFGPWEEQFRLIPTLISRSLRNEPIEVVSPKIARDFIYVDDMVDACIAAMRSRGGSGRVFNVASGKQKTIGDVVRSVLSLTKSKSEVRWGAFQARSFDTTTWVGNPAVAKKILRWRAKTDFKNGLKKTIQWMKKAER